MLESRVLLGMIACLLFPATLLAAEAKGEWLVARGTAHIRIVDCAETLWGIVSWEAVPGIDKNNPDPAKRTRPILGMPVLLAMKPDRPDRWAGRLYNSQNGKTYTGGIILIAPNVLRVYGCILGILCGGENWSRVQPTGSDGRSPSDTATCSRLE